MNHRNFSNLVGEESQNKGNLLIKLWWKLWVMFQCVSLVSLTSRPSWLSGWSSQSEPLLVFSEFSSRQISWPRRAKSTEWQLLGIGCTFTWYIRPFKPYLPLRWFCVPSFRRCVCCHSIWKRAQRLCWWAKSLTMSIKHDAEKLLVNLLFSVGICRQAQIHIH